MQSWDEARHAVNAFEMNKTSEWLVNTYRYETDYFNFKPPLSMWAIIGCFKLFGVSTFSVRCSSAIAMLLVFVVCMLFIARNFGKIEAVLFGGLFLCCSDMIFFHMGRSGDADALFMLFFVLGMICLYYALEHPWFLELVGLCFALAFLAKCFHAALLPMAAAALYIRYHKRMPLAHVLGCMIAAFIPVGVWGVFRYRFDGMDFFNGMLGIEVVERIQTAHNYFGYIVNYLSMPLVTGSIVIILVMGILLFRNRETRRDFLMKLKNSKKACWLAIWILVPVLVYSASGAYMPWYGYVGLLPMVIAGSVLLGRGFKELLKRQNYVLFAILLIPVVLFFGYKQYKNFDRLSKLRYECNVDIRNDIVSAMEDFPEYKGYNAYIINDRNEYLTPECWEQNLVWEAEANADFYCIDGGVDAFVNDPHGVMIIAKNSFEEYSGILSGRVILVDGDYYLIFCNEFY